MITFAIITIKTTLNQTTFKIKRLLIVGMLLLQIKYPRGNKRDFKRNLVTAIDKRTKSKDQRQKKFIICNRQKIKDIRNSLTTAEHYSTQQRHDGYNGNKAFSNLLNF